MRKILIVGAGQAGLQLALGLQRHGYDVTVVSDRAPDDIAAGECVTQRTGVIGATPGKRSLPRTGPAVATSALPSGSSPPVSQSSTSSPRTSTIWPGSSPRAGSR